MRTNNGQMLANNRSFTLVVQTSCLNEFEDYVTDLLAVYRVQQDNKKLVEIKHTFETLYEERHDFFFHSFREDRFY